MSRSPNRTQAVIDKLNESFVKSPYYLELRDEPDGDTVPKDEKLLSVIIPARNEFPNIVHTFYSIMHSWEASGFKPNDIEVIIVSNCSDDWNDDKYEWDKPGNRGTTAYMLARGAYGQGDLRVIYDPIAGNHSTRNKGARVARGKYLFFSDAHMAYHPLFFKYGIQALEETGGLVHGGLNWMGAYARNSEDSRTGMQYTIKLGEEWKGTWNPYRPWSDDWFYIPAQGHASIFAPRKQFLEFGGYPEVHRAYGGGEFYLDMKWWMFGSTVAADPRCIAYHLASGRGYVWHHDHYIENVLGCSYALGCDDWRERTYINYLRRGRKEVLDAIMARNEKEYAKDRKFVEERRVKTFNEVLVERPWDKMNIAKKGVANSSMLIFHDTWLDLLKDSSEVAKEAYANSKYQKGLEEFINKHLANFVYKRSKEAVDNSS